MEINTKDYLLHDDVWNKLSTEEKLENIREFLIDFVEEVKNNNE